MKDILWEERGQLGIDWYFTGFLSESLHLGLKVARGRQVCGQSWPCRKDQSHNKMTPILLGISLH